MFGQINDFSQIRASLVSPRNELGAGVEFLKGAGPHAGYVCFFAMRQSAKIGRCEFLDCGKVGT